jgi:hypothetical protein
MNEPTVTVTLTVRQAASLCHACLLLRDTLKDAHVGLDGEGPLELAHLKLCVALERAEQ